MDTASLAVPILYHEHAQQPRDMCALANWLVLARSAKRQTDSWRTQLKTCIPPICSSLHEEATVKLSVGGSAQLKQKHKRGLLCSNATCCAVTL